MQWFLRLRSAGLSSFLSLLLVTAAHAESKLDLKVDFAAEPGTTSENQLILSSNMIELGSGLYTLAVKLDANVCQQNGISPVVLNVLYHGDSGIIKNEPFEPTSQEDCERGSLQFDFNIQDIGATELNLYARSALNLHHPGQIEALNQRAGGSKLTERTQSSTSEREKAPPNAEISPTANTETTSGRMYLDQAAPYLDFIRDHLWQPVGSGSLAGLRALAETEKSLDGNVWFWTDDNAKGLETYLVPEAYARYHDIADSLLTFIRRMSDGPVMLRRIAKPNVKIESENPENFRVRTGLMNYHGNLRAGEINLSYSFHDGRDVDAMKLVSNWIRFDLNGLTHQFDVEDSIVSARLVQRDGLVILEHVSEFAVSSSPVARVTYSYTIDPAFTLIRLEISVEALNGATLANVHVTSAMDQLSKLPQGIAYHRFCGMGPNGLSCRNVAEEDRTVLAQGRLNWFSLIQLGNLGFSYGIHVQPSDPEQLVEVVNEAGERHDRFHHVYSTYDVGQIVEGTPGHVREAMLLTSGGLYQSMEVYGDLIKNAGNDPAIDFSASYDYGAELNAVGCYYMFASSGSYEPLRHRDDPEVVSIKNWFDRHLSMFERNFLTEQDDKENPYPFLFGRGVAFAILATDCMHRATGDARYLVSMKKMVEILLRGQRHEGRREYDGNFRCNAADSYLDCQGAIILALARASLALDDARLGPAIVDGVNALKMNRWQAMESSSVVARGDGEISMNVSPRRGSERDGILWGFKAGLLLRGLAAAEFAADAGRIAIDQHTRWYMNELMAAATDYIHTSTLSRGDSLEILTSYRSGETNSESQPWMLLGLYPIDAIVAQVQPAGSGAP